MSEAPSSPAAPMTAVSASQELRAWQVLAIVVFAQVVGIPAAACTWEVLARQKSESGAHAAKPPVTTGGHSDRQRLRHELAGCEKFDGPSCFMAAKLLSELNEDRSYSDEGTPAFDVLGALRRGCALKSGPACSVLGKRREAGDGVEQDYLIAARLFQRACKLKTPSGCGRLGRLHEFGRGMPVDLARASQLYARACDLGATMGCTDLKRLEKRADP